MTQVVFFGSSPFSVVVLQKLVLSTQIKVLSVVTNEDKPAGRHLKLTPNPVKVFAQENNINVQYSMFNVQLVPGTIGFVAAYGKIIPQEVLDSFGGKMYNIHPSLLPKYRGASPLQQQILDGATQTGVTIIQMDAQMDHGPIVAVAHDTIRPDDTTVTLGERLFATGADLFLSKIQDLGSKICEQNHNEATYTKKLTRQDGFIPWESLTSNIQDLGSKKRAFSPWPGVWTLDPQGKRLKIS